MLYPRDNETFTPELAAIVEYLGCKPKRFGANMRLFREGDANDHLLMILDGIVKVAKEDIDGNLKLIGLAGANELMGFTGFFTKKQYSASVISVTSVNAYELYYDDLVRLIDHNPGVRYYLYREMELYMEYYINISIIQSYNSIESQLARILSNLANRFGVKKTDGSVDISMKLTDEMLGSIIGTNRETVTRILSKMKDLKMLSKKNRIITICDLAKLQSLYGFDENKNSSRSCPL